MCRRALALSVSLVVLLAAPGVLVGCGRDKPEAKEPAQVDTETGPVVPRSAVVGHPPADRWEVEVAVVKPDVDPAILLPEQPREKAAASGRTHPDRESSPPRIRTGTDSLTIADVATEAPDLVAEEAASAESPLTPIPSPGLSWGSAAVDGHWEYDNPTVIGSPLIFLVVEDRGEWLRVLFPARPNHQTGWIARDDVDIVRHNWHAEVDTTANRLRVWEGDKVRVDTLVVAGTPTTPTPLGRYYINEKQAQESPYTPYGSWILSTNGFSEAHERFSGEVPIFALHGTPYPDTIGQDLSNGCIRMPNDLVEYLAEHMPVGTPVDVFA